jgi:L-histidine N-alpha-methyltransferase
MVTDEADTQVDVPPPRRAENVTISNVLTDIRNDALIRSILGALNEVPRRISSKFLYDQKGSQLFEQITKLPEYYPTRTEKKLLQQFSESLKGILADVDIVELGSGDCSKISIILDSMSGRQRASIRYVPVDVSEYALRQSASVLTEKYPALAIHGIAADFMTQLDSIPQEKSRIFCFLGSTIGNLAPEQRRRFLRNIADTMTPGDRLLLGVDMIKPVDVLERAYNDSRGVTAQFNRNSLSVVNRIAGTDFVPEQFEHLAFFNPSHGRVEMHLKAKSAMTVKSRHASSPMTIKEDEMIHTENSHKFELGDIASELSASGFQIETLAQDSKEWFSLMLLSRDKG